MNNLNYLLNQFLIFSLLGFISMSSCAQKSKVLSAYHFQQAYYSNKDCGELQKAMEAIELALTHEVSSEWAKTWYYRGNIYYDIYVSVDDACRGLSEPALDLAYESYMKSIELDVKEQYIKDIEPRISVISSLYVQRGAAMFNVKKYNEALLDFEKSVEVARYFKKTDTTALYNAALAAEKVQNYSKSAMYYEGLIDIGFSQPRLYHFLAEAYEKLEQPDKSFQAIKAGRIAYPSNQDLIIDELNYYLSNGKEDLALENLDVAINSMPDNAELYFARGTIYDDKQEWEKARDDYKLAIEHNPDHFNANYNLGALFFNKGVESIEKANSYGENQVSLFKAAVAEGDEFFNQSLPYLEKANQLDPHDRATMVSLKNLYSRIGNEEGYKRISEILDN